MWVVKTHGDTYYVEHVDASIPWSTKETPDNPSTKGSLKFKECLLSINDDNQASIDILTDHDKIRLRNRFKGITRIITKQYSELSSRLKENGIKHGPIKSFGGACSATFYVVDILEKSHLTLLTLVMQDFRILAENEFYYKAYDDPKFKDGYNDMDSLDYDDFYDYDEEETEDEEGMGKSRSPKQGFYRSVQDDSRFAHITWAISIVLATLLDAGRKIFKK
jgi:hypothetical protein